MADGSGGFDVADFAPLISTEDCAHHARVNVIWQGAKLVNIVSCHLSWTTFEPSEHCEFVGFSACFVEPFASCLVKEGQNGLMEVHASGKRLMNMGAFSKVIEEIWLWRLATASS